MRQLVVRLFLSEDEQDWHLKFANEGFQPEEVEEAMMALFFGIRGFLTGDPSVQITNKTDVGGGVFIEDAPEYPEDLQ